MKIVSYNPFTMLGVEFLSDIEINEEQKSYSVEWDGMWGKHWQSFGTESEMTEALDENAKYNALLFVKEYLHEARKKFHFVATESLIKNDWKFDVKVEARKLIRTHNDLIGKSKSSSAATFTMGDLLSKLNLKLD